MNKHSLSFVGSQQNRSSKMSATLNNVNVAAAMSMSKSGGAAKSSIEEDAAENVDRILALMQQLREIEENKIQRAKEANKETEDSMPILK